MNDLLCREVCCNLVIDPALGNPLSGRRVVPFTLSHHLFSLSRMWSMLFSSGSPCHSGVAGPHRIPANTNAGTCPPQGHRQWSTLYAFQCSELYDNRETLTQVSHSNGATHMIPILRTPQFICTGIRKPSVQRQQCSHSGQWRQAV